MINYDMRELLKKPNVYFLTVVGVALLWIFVVGVFFLPRLSGKRAKLVAEYGKVNDLAKQIYELDPARISYAGEKEKVGKFNFSVVITDLAGKYGIVPGEYDLSTQKARRNRGKVSQGATMVIKETSITELSHFLADILDRWPSLQCENIKLTADSKEPDTWKATVKFTYNF